MLTESQVRQFHDEGYLFLPETFSSEEVAIRSIFPHEIDSYDPYEGEVRVWQN